jgi:hypothetical protein
MDLLLFLVEGSAWNNAIYDYWWIWFIREVVAVVVVGAQFLLTCCGKLKLAGHISVGCLQFV